MPLRWLHHRVFEVGGDPGTLCCPFAEGFWIGDGAVLEAVARCGSDSGGLPAFREK